MKELKNLISDPPQREQLITDCVDLINSEVRSKSGLSGMAVKTAFSVIKAIKPRILEDSVDSLLDEFVDALQPFYASYQEGGEQGSMESYLDARRSEVSDGLLAITDRRAARSRNKTIPKAYNKLRPKGKTHVEAATPGVGRVLDKHLPSLG